MSEEAALLTGDWDLAWRAEQAGLNASAPPQQQRVEGWLIRLSPGKAKRSRCINALEAGSLPLDDLLSRCQHAFQAAGLPLIVRLTPFTQPADLDATLSAKGWARFDAADVMVRAHLDELPAALPPGQSLELLDAPSYANLVGALRESSAVEIEAHAQRLLASPVVYQGHTLRDEHGELLACGQLACEGAMAGLYDVFTPPARRGQGHARVLCAALLERAKSKGSTQAYLQVGSDNESAQRAYRHLGFAVAYRYHYRSPEPSV
ncbi:GNAT family N-acetyltransferase [Roseateles sp.]|uniref:GNAT family N-acetyltransferase n=1 Tax=Roseateles sp. TaxID=1971397 RepID=UPI003D0F5CB0